MNAAAKTAPEKPTVGTYKTTTSKGGRVIVEVISGQHQGKSVQFIITPPSTAYFNSRKPAKQAG